MNINENPDHNLINTGQAWIAEAIAQQEEHLRRIRSCTASRYPHLARPLLDHSWETFSPAPFCEPYEACWLCGVTRTDDDYQRKILPRQRK